MKRLGISIYPEKSTKEDILAYLDRAADAGFSRIFSCLLSVQDTKEAIVQKWDKVQQRVREEDNENRKVVNAYDV